MANRDIDVVIESAASNSFLPLGLSSVDLTFYARAVKIRNLKRTLLNIGCGSLGQGADAGDQSGNITDLVAAIDKATGGDMQRIGALCLYGTSNGSGQTLGLALTLQKRGAPKATYVGLGDLTLMPFGRNPPVPGIGNLQPVNAPRVSFGTGINPFATLKAFGLPPNVDDNDPPRIFDPGVVADILENYYTHAGNRMRVYAQSPAGANNWWWTSTQTFGEVHGEIPGSWKNKRLATISDGSILNRGPGSVDEGHHDSLCGQARLAMSHEAGIALGNFVTKLLPAP